MEGGGLLSTGGRKAALGQGQDPPLEREEGGAPEAAQTPWTGQNPRAACAETLKWEELGRAVKTG